MIPLILELPQDESILLFGPRGVGKTTHIRNLAWFEKAIYINLLQTDAENRFSRRPDELTEVAMAAEGFTHIIIDEIQKIPKLLDVVHDLIESPDCDIKFILTGSSARKLKYGGANLLAGRAFVYNLSPFTFTEAGESFQLDSALRWGMLPKIFDYDDDKKKLKCLEAYVNTYIKEEVWVEQDFNSMGPPTFT